MTTGRRSAAHLLVQGAALCLLVPFAWRLDWGAAATARASNPALLAAAVVVNLASLALKGVRWWVFLRPLGVRSLALVMRATFAGASLNNVLVAQGGEGARVVMVSRASAVSGARVLAALATERLLDAVSYLVLLVGAGWLLPLPPVVARWRIVGSVLLGVVGLLLGALVIGSRNVVTPEVEGAHPERDPLTSATRWLAVRARAFGSRFVRGVGEVLSPSRLATGLVLSFGAWALQVATYHLVARSAHLALPAAGSIAALLAVGISFLIRATPGNIGVFQVVYALAIGPFGVGREAAVAVAVLLQLVQVVPVLVIGTLFAPVLAPRRSA